ncbi:hypothetical protein [Psychroserpens damuponensis]|uniref:hypothetical protein n=1 Tax=Psychroserpens damuponensis TaxID=943936 RepID=UPI00058FCBEF|nr:hypothetical protein [Psychroserpens damuponensis]
MKRVLLILAFTLLPLLSMAQLSNEAVKNDNTIETVIEQQPDSKIIKQETTASSAMKAKVLKINRKKSTEIISIKAYRKSLQIKVKTVKLC